MPRVSLVLAALALASLGLLVVAGIRVVSLFRTHDVPIAAGNSKSPGFVLTKALAAVVAQQHPRIRITAVETAGSEESLSRLVGRGARMAVVEADPSLPSTARSVARLFDETLHVIVRRRPEPPKPPEAAAPAPNAAPAEEAPPATPAVTGFRGLRGQRIGLAKVGIQYKTFLDVANQYGLKDSDFTLVGGDDASAARAFGYGDVDAVVRSAPLEDDSIASLLAGGNASFVPIDTGAALHLKNGVYAAAVIPKALYRGQPPVPASDTPTVSRQRLLLARTDVDPEVIYAIAEVLTERRKELTAAIPEEFAWVRPMVARITEPRTDRALDPPVHAGARSYQVRRDWPFIVRNARDIAICLAALLLALLWITALRRKTAVREQRRWSQHKLRVIELIAETDRTGVLELGPFKTELLRIKTEALQDRDRGKLTEEQFESFHEVWKAAMDVAKIQQAIAEAPRAPAPRPEAARAAAS